MNTDMKREKFWHNNHAMINGLTLGWDEREYTLYIYRELTKEEEEENLGRTQLLDYFFTNALIKKIKLDKKPTKAKVEKLLLLI